MFATQRALMASVCLAAGVAVATLAQAQPFRPGAGPEPALPSNPVPAAPADADGEIYLGLTADSAALGGVEVLSVDPNGPASVATLRAGDVILRVDGQRTSTVDAFGEKLSSRKPGDRVRFEVQRGGQLLELTAQLSARPPGEGPPSGGPPGPLDPVAPQRDEAWLGVATSAIDQITALRRGLPAIRGAVVESVVPGSPAWAARIPEGSVIVSVDGKPVENPADLRAAVISRRPGERVTVQYYDGAAMRTSQVALAAKEDPVPGSKLPSALRPQLPASRAELLLELQAVRREVDLLQQRIERLEQQLQRAP